MAHRRAGRIAPTGARTRSTGARTARPSGCGWATCRRPASGSGWRCRSTSLKLAPGTVIDGWAFTQHGGTVYWDEAGHHDPDPRRTASSTTRSRPGSAAQRGRRRRGAAGEPQGDRPGRSSASGPRPRPRSFATTSSSTPTPRRRAISAPLRAEAGGGRAEAEGRSSSSSPRRWSSARRPASRSRRILLKRGEYDQRGEKVGRGVPAFLPPLPPGAPVNRLGLARWLVAPNHPLTARVAVNRFWHQVFGTGIVKTAEDFGAQGEPPSHPELLDWLAVQFREDGWDVKRFMKRLVMSAAYRQSSRVTPEKLAKDPDNRLLSRGPRFRLDAEMLRDQALFAGGLLVEHVGGPSVKPPQPAGLWEAVGYTDSNTAHFVADAGAEKVHRRSLYTFWKRTSAAAADDHLRRPVARGLHGAPRADQHAAPGPPPDERAAVRRGARARWPSGRSARPGRPTDDRLTLPVPPGDRPMPRRRRSSPSSSAALKDLTAHYASRARRRQAVDRDRRDQARPPLRPRRAGRLDDDRQRRPEPRRSDHQGMISQFRQRFEHADVDRSDDRSQSLTDSRLTTEH